MKMPPNWATVLLAVLIGWLALLFSAFLLFISFSSLAACFGIDIFYGDVSFVLLAIIVLAIAAVLAFLVARRCYIRASRSNASTVLVLLTIVIVVTVLSFPAVFTYGIVVE